MRYFYLQQAGLRVHYPQQQSCCGQPAYSSGNPQQAREVARAQLDLFAQPWPVVVPSGSCAGMMRHHWPALFADEPEWHAKALALAERVFELTEFYLHVLQHRCHSHRLTIQSRPNIWPYIHPVLHAVKWEPVCMVWKC
jgi:L-lactate dehydrogenase complex protein LldE